LGIRQADLPAVGFPLRRRHLCTPVDPGGDCRAHFLFDIEFIELRVDQAPVIDQDHDLVRRQPHALEEGCQHGHGLSVRFGGVRAEHVHIPLEELARASFLGSLIAPERSE
jgi:hypothetical protein